MKARWSIDGSMALKKTPPSALVNTNSIVIIIEILNHLIYIRSIFVRLPPFDGLKPHALSELVAGMSRHECRRLFAI